MIRRRAKAVGIAMLRPATSQHTTGITALMANHETLEGAQNIAAHASRTGTELYDHSADDIRWTMWKKILV